MTVGIYLIAAIFDFVGTLKYPFFVKKQKQDKRLIQSLQDG